MKFDGAIGQWIQDCKLSLQLIEHKVEPTNSIVLVGGVVVAVGIAGGSPALLRVFRAKFARRAEGSAFWAAEWGLCEEGGE